MTNATFAPGDDGPVAAIKVRRLDGVDPSALPPGHFDGKTLQAKG